METPPTFRRSSDSILDRDVFQRISPSERDTLARLASQISRSQTMYSRRNAVSADSRLQRKDTLDGLDMNDPVYDPNSPSFDLYKWLRMTMRILDEDGIKIKRAGVVVKNLNISGSGSALNLQKTVGSYLMAPFRATEYIHPRRKPAKHILRNFHGSLKSSEMLIVLGRPGSGCSTLLRSLTGEMHGLAQSDDSLIHYNGITQKQMLQEFKGEVAYNQEVDKHFPHLTVGQTLEHAAALRMSSHRALGTSRKEAVKHITQIVMSVYGLSHTYNTKVCSAQYPPPLSQLTDILGRERHCQGCFR